MSFLKPQVIFRETTLLYFFSSNITYLTKVAHEISNARYKINQIPHVVLQTKS